MSFCSVAGLSSQVSAVTDPLLVGDGWLVYCIWFQQETITDLQEDAEMLFLCLIRQKLMQESTDVFPGVF